MTLKSVLVLLLLMCTSICHERKQDSKQSRCCYITNYSVVMNASKDYYKEFKDLNPDMASLEDVDDISEVRCISDKKYYCMSYLQIEPMNDKSLQKIRAYRGFGGLAWNSSCAWKFAHYRIMYCNECVSDLCNNASLWNPQEIRYLNNSFSLSGVIKRYLSPSLIVTVVILHVIRVVRM
jgi:hypothetical protein